MGDKGNVIDFTEAKAKREEHREQAIIEDISAALNHEGVFQIPDGTWVTLPAVKLKALMIAASMHGDCECGKEAPTEAITMRVCTVCGLERDGTPPTPEAG